MELIQLLAAMILLGIVYKKMLHWNPLGDISKKQAYVPVAFGVLSTVLSFIIVLAVGILWINYCGASNLSLQNQVLESLVSAFLKAGLAEELAKLLMILLSIKLFRPKNVYECALIGGAVGIGFTLHEELLYGGSLIGLTRLLTVFLHTAIGLIMCKYIGLGMYNKQNNLPYKFNYALSLIVPITIHTIYDACTASNFALKEGASLDEETLAFGLIMGLVCVIVAAVWQIIVIRNLKKNAEKYAKYYALK